jgi:pSer/pThr/pTyr-binding forkhead associated (FHA) protein
MAKGPVLRVGRLRHPLSASVTTVGRLPSRAQADGGRPDIDLGRIDRRKVVSRRHAQLICDGKCVYVRDIGSTNGTLVNRRLLVKGSVAMLRNGDTISFGGVEARFETQGRWPAGLVAQWSMRPGQTDHDPPPDDTLRGPRATGA